MSCRPRKEMNPRGCEWRSMSWHIKHELRLCFSTTASSELAHPVNQPAQWGWQNWVPLLGLSDRENPASKWTVTLLKPSKVLKHSWECKDGRKGWWGTRGRVRTTDERREYERERLGSSNETSAAEMFSNAISTSQTNYWRQKLRRAGVSSLWSDSVQEELEATGLNLHETNS
jgi:hypothetical protein